MQFSDFVNFRSLAAAGAIAVAQVVSGGAHAAPLPAVFYVGGVFDDGGTLTGQFGINVYGFNDKDAASLIASAGTTLTSTLVYTLPVIDPQIHPSAPLDATSLAWVDVFLSPYRELHLSFFTKINEAVQPDTFSPTTFLPLTLDLAHSYECISYSCPGPSGTGGNTRYLIGGVIGDTPESVAGLGQTPLPGALPLFASGAGLFGFLGWRRKRKSAVA